MPRARFLEQLEDRRVLNGIPIAKEDLSYHTPVNTALVVSTNPLLANDWDPEGSSLTASIVANPANGTISSFSSSAGTFTYTPNSSYTGVDTFTYKVNDGISDSDTVTVAIAVGGHFGPRTNLEESPLAFSGGCAANATPIKFNASCLTGDLEYAQPLTPGFQLLYNSGTLPQPIIVLETFLQSTSAVPNEIKAKLTFNGTAGTEYSYDTATLVAGGSLRFALQADATSLPTGRYAYTVRLTARFNTTEVTRDYTGFALVVNRGSNTYEFGRGWQLAGLDRLVSATGGKMLVRSTGDALWFADDGSGGYRRAAGDQSFATLVQNVGGTFTLTDKNGIKANFSSAGLLTSHVDRNSNTVTYSYTNDLLTQMSDPFSRNTVLAYTSGRLSSITDSASRAATLAYDASGRLISVNQPDPDGAGPLAAPVWSMAYDATTNKLTQLINPLTHATSFAYGSHQRLTTITHPDTRTWQSGRLQTIGLPTATSGNTLVAANPVGSMTNENSGQSIFRTDRFGRITEWTDPSNNQTFVVRSVDGLVAKTTLPDPDGAGGSLTSPITILGYDVLGNLKYQKNPDNSTKTWSYSTNFNFVLSATDELNRTQSFGYDTSGNMTSFTDAAGYVTTATYTTRGLVASFTTPDPDGAGPLVASVTNLAYDTNGRLTTLTNPDSSTRAYTYDTADNRLTDRDELLRTTSFAYDLLGRMTSTTDRVNATTSLTYNALGLVTKSTDALGNATDYEYNNRNFLTRKLQPDPDGAGSLTRPQSDFGYDFVGNLTTIGEPGYFGAPLTHSYDGANRRTRTRQTIDTTNIDTNFNFDNLGRLIKVTNALGHETAYEYTSRSWLSKITGQDPDGAGPGIGPITQYGYDVAGQRTSETDPRGFVTVDTFNSRGLLASTSLPDPDGSGGPQWAPLTIYAYDNAGRLKQIDDPYCRVTVYAHNNRDWVTSVTKPDPDQGGPLLAPVTSFGYDVAGRMTSTTDPLSRATTFGYDHEGRATSTTLADPDGGGPLTSPVWTTVYNLMGSVTSVTDPRGNATSFQYDTLQRRSSMTQSDPDGGGPLSAPVTNYVYGSNTSLSKITDPIGRDITYGYDVLGRRTSTKDHLNNQTSLAYDNFNRLTTITAPDPDGAGPLTPPLQVMAMTCGTS